jgi:hypothetical protein
MFKEKFKKKIAMGLMSLITLNNPNKINVIMFTNIMTSVKDSKRLQNILDSKQNSKQEFISDLEKDLETSLNSVVEKNKELLVDGLHNDPSFKLNLKSIFDDLFTSYDVYIDLIKIKLIEKKAYDSNMNSIEQKILEPNSKKTAKSMEIFLSYSPIAKSIVKLFKSNDNSENQILEDFKFKEVIEKMSDFDLVNLSALMQRQLIVLQTIFEVYQKKFD